MEFKNYIFDLYATLVDIHTDQEPLDFWWRVAAIMDAYGSRYEPLKMKTRYRQLIQDREERLARELGTSFPEIELGDVFKEMLLSPPVVRNDGIWGDPRRWSEDELERWCSAFAWSFRVTSRIKFRLYPDTLALLEGLKREGKHVYLLSNAQSLFTRPELEELGPGTISCQIQKGVPFTEAVKRTPFYLVETVRLSGPRNLSFLAGRRLVTSSS